MPKKTRGKPSRDMVFKYRYASGDWDHYTQVGCLGSSWSSITYGENPRPAPNYCYHHRLKAGVPRNSYSYGSSGSALWEYVGVPYGSGGEVMYHHLFPAGFAGRAFTAMLPKLSSSFSAPDFLRELMELKQLFEGLRHIAQLLVGYKRPKGLVREAADTVLLTSFGINPTVSDVFKMMSLIEEFRTAITNFKKRSGKSETAHYSETIGEIHNHSNDWHPDATTWRYTGDLTYGEAKVIATMHYKFELHSDIGFNVPSFKKFIGFRNNPKLIWNAIPFSFVVDWFLKIGNMLNRLDEDAIPCNLKIFGFTMSMKATNKFRVTATWRESYPIMSPPFGHEFQVLDATYTYYIRRYLTPYEAKNSIVLPQIGSISVRELVLAIAMLL